MPPLARAYIKTGMLFFAASFVLGSLLLLNAAVTLPPLVGALQPTYFHLLMVGWVTQLIFGVVFWMFPRLSREQPRGSERLGWLTYYSLNAGLLLRLIAEPWNTVAPNPIIAWLLPLSALLQLIAAWVFVANTWGRVKGK
ncbi:MAG: cbb3-type cytochrome c oxidase subunit I [Ardenticatenaceae bacterium]|nr:cbb3-type cytochrome c oxidase subunit I [Ardenticatenaceae bacterium]HBY98951.1 hypothetical protein [Chloroflexota bacterium]